jgi:hypothetical protein
MTNDDARSASPAPGDDEPTDPTDDEQPAADLDPDEIEAAVETYQRELYAAKRTALGHLEDEIDVSNAKELYEFGGFDATPVRLELELYDAEVYVLLDLLDRLTDSEQIASSFVPQARLLTRLLEATPTSEITAWFQSNDRPGYDAPDLEADDSDQDAADDQDADEDGGEQA